MFMDEIVKRAMCRWCHSQCRVAVSTKDGRLDSIDEDKTDPRWEMILPRTRACPRLRAAKEYVYHADRVRFPLKRKGERGENRWERVEWDQALDDIAKKLESIKQSYGPESLMVTSGTGRTMLWPRLRFMNLFGSPNAVGQGTICYAPVLTCASAITGWNLAHRTSLVISSACKSVFLVGINPAQAYQRLWKSVREGKKRGVKFVVADPRRTEMAELADIWLQLRPGTDAALLMAMIHVVIEERLYDEDFVQKWCYGFEELVERAKKYPVERVAEITGISSSVIRQAAIMLGQERPGIGVHGMGLEQLESQQDSIQARLILMAILGNLDVEGGDYMGGPPECVTGEQLELSEKLSPEQKRKQIGADRFKLLSWPGRELIRKYVKEFWGKESICRSYAHFPSVLRAITTGDPYPVRAAITTFSNPMVTQPNTKLVYKAFKALDLYIANDFWLTPSALLADYVLPTACWLERPQAEPVMADNRIMAGERALPASMPGEYSYWTDYEFFRGLGVRLGQEEYWPWKTDEEVLDYRLAPLGMTLETFMREKDGVHFPPREYKKYERMGGFGTPTGKVELSSKILEMLGYDPLPRYEEPKESPVSLPRKMQEYPLMLITGGRFQPYFHSEHRQIESIRRKRPDPRVQIHPQTAGNLGIEDGDWVWIETMRGRIRQKCSIFDGIAPEVIHCEHGWWFPELPAEEPWLGGVWESNVNVLMDDEPDHCDPKSGGWPLKSAICRVYKCRTYCSGR